MNTVRRFHYLLSVIRRHFVLWLVSIAGLCILYYVLMLLALVIKFQALPNYINVFDWMDNVAWIMASTPSLQDALAIIREEWWLEIGFMNYDFGTGISEWSLFISPWKMLTVMAFLALLVSYMLVLKYRVTQCRATVNYAAKVSSGVGGLCFALTSLTMSWVVCCATPTWIVGLAIMGLGVSTSLAIEPVGVWLNLLGFLLMMVALYMSLQDAPVELTAENEVKKRMRNKV
jgi:hypothetical protein